MIQGNDIDDDIDVCLNDGISSLNFHITNNCKSIEQYQAMFNDSNELPTQLGAILPMLVNTITQKKKKFGGAQKKTAV